MKQCVLLQGGYSEVIPSNDSAKFIGKVLQKLNVNFILLNPADCDIENELRNLQLPVINMVHGIWGEDGQASSLCEKLNLAYYGSSQKACEISWNKKLSKQLAAKLKIQYPKELCSAQNYNLLNIFPHIIRPVQDGSSNNIYLVNSKAEKLAYVNDKYMIEEYITGTEVTVGIWNDQCVGGLVIQSLKTFFDYEAKYKLNTKLINAQDVLKKDVWINLQKMSLATHRKMQCSGITRLDWIIHNDIPYFLELNTIPGMTSHSLFPKICELNNIDLTNVVREMLTYIGIQV